MDMSLSLFNGKVDFSKCQFSGDVEIWSARFEKKLNFSMAKFSGRLIVCDARVNEDLTFSRSKFFGDVYLSILDVKGDIDFYYSDFSSLFSVKFVKIENNLIFARAKFLDYVVMSGLTVFKKTNFFEAEFLKDVFFKIAIRGDFFEYVKVNPKDDMKCVKIIDDVNFESATFHKDVYFDSVKFSGVTLFKSARFMQSVRFTSVVFESDVQFDNALIKNDLLIFNEEIKSTPENGVMSFKNIMIRGKARIVNVMLKNFSFLGFDVACFEFDNCSWKVDNKNNFYIFNEENGCTIEELKKYEGVYRTLKKRAIDNHDELMASAWHYQEKSIAKRLLSKKQCKNLQDKLLSIFLCLYKFCSGYGEDPARAIVALMILILAMFIFVFGSYIYDVGMESYEITWSGLCSVIKRTFKLALFMDAGIKIDNIFSAAALIVSRVLLPIQAALFALSLRNKLRR